ncbi:hypothetical protein A9K65_028750 [Mesorhizobium sp. WSM1497]|nr:hypothetical protein A4R29_07020 [Mesorhizobium ciceri biovar biserrulae]ARP66893.1 hypothetical protein A9K65_028750 [Mesorhizobium sp. WSM1497]
MIQAPPNGGPGHIVCAITFRPRLAQVDAPAAVGTDVEIFRKIVGIQDSDVPAKFSLDIDVYY